MGCAALNYRAGLNKEKSNIVYDSNSEKLPPQVLEGFEKILKSVKKKNDIKKPQPLSSRQKRQNLNALLPQNSDMIPAETNKDQTLPKNSEKDENERKVPEKQESIPQESVIAPEILKKKESIQFPHIERKITIHSELKIERVRKDSALSDLISEHDPREEANAEDDNIEETKQAMENEEKPLLEMNFLDADSGQVPVIDFGFAEENDVNFTSNIKQSAN
ncbi:hypothetical protein SteCoe_31561 [Stentor coeruleus]|uniref:Uncharacterized protein n=1 Tax=Stentor coeruleus TaxID=5963 RepID=A0A1R2B175_9CILI|nr:hypothetical protein SteCoe_31561 [Stentor coeruleus]